ncbi:hypothetical protein [Natrinema salifodinae]|uniref:hypothetical protein n=1 Tax=Natrinema salifodinae TaxID=1202768 RepID=UPI0009443B17|nr:hypothetical protein [Natrinema salifodinae]
MRNTVQEIEFNIVVTVASSLALIIYMLMGVSDPLPAIVLGGVLIGTVIFVPREAWLPSGVLGVGAVIIAGVLVPRIVVEFTTVSNEMSITVLLSAVILLSTFAALHLSTSRYQKSRTA